MVQPLRVLLHNDKTDALAAKLRADFPVVEVETCNTYGELADVVKTFRPSVIYSVRFAGSDGFPLEALFSPDGPDWIANGGAGTDHLGQWDPNRITVTNAAGVAADMMAEYVLGSFLHFTLDVPAFQADKANRLWQARKVRPLKGQTLVIVGLGHTGQAIAMRAKAMGMNVLGTRTTPVKMNYVDEVHGADRLRDLLPRADFIAVSTPLTVQTRGLLDDHAFSAMKPGVILADVSRGQIVSETALLSALRSGRVAAAALDVFETEPLPSDNPLWDVKNLLISPHCSSVHEGWEAASFDLFLENLANRLAGRPLFNIVDPKRGY